MIESVNSSIANASLLRTQIVRDAERSSTQIDDVNMNAAPTTSVQTTQLPGLSQPIVQILDANTGDVLSQYPSQGSVAAREQAADKANDAFFDNLYGTSNSGSSEEVFVVGQKTAGDVETQQRDAEQKYITEAQIAIAALYTGSQSGISPQQLLSTMVWS